MPQRVSRVFVDTDVLTRFGLEGNEAQWLECRASSQKDRKNDNGKYFLHPHGGRGHGQFHAFDGSCDWESGVNGNCKRAHSHRPAVGDSARDFHIAVQANIAVQVRLTTSSTAPGSSPVNNHQLVLTAQT